MQLKCSQVQKRSKYIGKTVHVTSVAQLSFCDATRICLWRAWERSDFINNNYIFVPKINEGLTGLEWHEGK